MGKEFDYTAEQIKQAWGGAVSKYYTHGLNSDKNVLAQIVVSDAERRGISDKDSHCRDHGQPHAYMRRHIPNMAGCRVSINLYSWQSDGMKDGASVLSEARMNLSERDSIEPIQRDYLIKRIARMLLDEFIQKLGGQDLMNAVLAQCIEKGDFARRIKRGDFDCQARG